jgi:hypothetical protein
LQRQHHQPRGAWPHVDHLSTLLGRGSQVTDELAV